LRKSTDWKTLSLEDLEREYNPSSMIGGDYLPYIKQYINKSQLSKKRLNLIECEYGPKPTNTIDLFIPKSASQKAPCPIMVFIHGGYWQELSKNESQFSAMDFVKNDIAFAAVDYTLCPKASISDIINECKAAINWLQSSFHKYNYDPKNIYISGSSAGAHLAAMCCLENSKEKDQSLVKLAGVVLVSGIYDLEPLIPTTINNSIGMDKNSAMAASPLFKNLSDFPNTIITWGENETIEFKEQSIIFSEALTNNGINVQTIEIRNRNHFDIILDLGKDDEDLGKKVIKMIKDGSS
jgi:arylformamidase